MKKIILLFGLLLVASLILTSCSIWKSEPSVPIPIIENNPLETEDNSAKEVIAVPYEEPLYNIRVQELKKLSEDIDTYKYLYHSIHRIDSGLMVQKVSYDVSINGINVKKSYPQSVTHDNKIYYFDVYLNLKEHSAFGVCSKTTTVTCEPELWKKAYKINYYQEQLGDTPLELVQSLDTKAKATGEMNYNNRKITMVDTQLSPTTYQRLYVDNFYGLALRQIIFVLNSDLEEVIIKDNYFDLVAAGAGSVKLIDVTLSPEIVKIE